MFESYTLESYTIPSTPFDIAMEASIEEQVGNGKLARKEKRLLNAVKNNDQEEAAKINQEIKDDAEKIKQAAKREKNIQVAKAALSIAAKAVSLGTMIYGMINSSKESKEWNKITTAGNGATNAQVQFINSLRNKTNTANKVSTAVDITSGILSML